MEVKVVFVRSLSQNIKILQCSKSELTKELSNVSSIVTELSYKSWALEVFIPGINIVFESIVAKAEEKGTSEVSKLKTLLFNKVIQINPLLEPKNLYVDSANTITFTKGNNVKLIDLDTWKIKEDSSSLMVLDLHQYFDISDQVKGYDHHVETDRLDILDLGIKVRVFPKSLRDTLVFGFDPKTEDEIKFYIISTCIDSFYQVYQYITQDISNDHISFPNIINALHDISIKHNPFLKLKIKDIKKINKNLHQFKKGTKDAEESQISTTTARQRLDKVPKDEILELDSNILRNIFGQDEAVSAVCNSVKRAYAGLKLNKKPIGTFLFYGPTSTGKTELAKVLAKVLTKSETDGLVKIACNTLQTDHTIHTLIGAPPSYVGYEDRGLLHSSFKKGKFKVLLFDEIEKATPKLFDLLLEMLEEGRILIADGSVIDLTETIIIMTSNIGQQEANNSLNTAGFETHKSKESEREKILENQYKKILKDKLKPEFLARLNGTFYFKELSEDSLLKTVELHLRRYVESWEKKVEVVITDPVYKLVLNNCKKEMGKRFHARNLRDYIDREIVQKLGDCLITLNADLKKLERIEIRVSKGEFVFNLIKNKQTNKA